MIKVDILFLTAQFLNIDLHLSIYMDQYRFTFVNIHGPNIDEQASPFYEDVFNEIYVSPNDIKMIAGDLNLVLDPDKDKVGGNVELHKASRQIILKNMENYDLMDMWPFCIQKKNNLPFSKLDPKKYFLAWISS